MSGQPEDGFGSQNDERLAPEDRAAMAAVDGLGSLSPFDAETVDLEEVAQLEAAAGALFMAFTRQRGALGGPPPSVEERLQGRLERAADLYVSSRLSEGAETEAETDAEAPTHRALGAADAGVSGAGVHSYREVRAEGFDASLGSSQPSQTVGGPTPASGRPERGGRQLSLLPALAGWAAAAALLVGLVTTARRAAQLEEGNLSTQEPATRMAQLQMTAADLVELDWQPLGTGARLRGGVVWSDARNEGFLRIKGLAVNDPSESQYQLWIFRGTDLGAEPYPVDGGVFNVSGDGEVLIPIDAKLGVGRASTFAVTVEQPGGVVVSGRDKVVALAQRAS